MKLMLIFLVLSSLQLWGSESDNQLFDRVVKQNMAIRSHEKLIRSEKSKEGHLKRSFLPSLSIELGQEQFQTGSYTRRSEPYGTLEARLNLFRGGLDRLESLNRELRAKIVYNNKEQSVRDEINKIRKIQFQIIFNNELLNLLKKEKEDNQKITEQAARRIRNGVSTRSDFLEFEIYSLELNEKVESLIHENKILLIGLAPLLGKESDEEFVLDSTLKHQHDDELMGRNYLFNSHPVVAGLDTEFENLKNDRKMNSLWWAPKFDLYGGYYLYTLRDRDYISINRREDTVVGLRLSMDIFDGLKGPTQSTSQYFQAESKRLKARYEEKQLEARFNMIKEDMKHTHEVMHYVLDRIKKSKDYLKLTLQEYDRGVKNSLDALTAMQRFYVYEKQYIEKKKEYQILKSDLLAIMGE